MENDRHRVPLVDPGNHPFKAPLGLYSDPFGFGDQPTVLLDQFVNLVRHTASLMPDSDLGRLYHARLRAQRRITKLQPELEGYRTKLAEIEAKIIKRDGLLFLPHHRRFNPYFKHGELPRIALQLMREADSYVTVRWPAGRALAMKGCPYQTPGVMKQARRRQSSMLTTWNKRGVAVKVGTWNASRQRLVTKLV